MSTDFGVNELRNQFGAFARIFSEDTADALADRFVEHDLRTMQFNFSALGYPELHFEGVRVVACHARAAGAKPIVLQTWTPAASDTAARGEIAYRVGNGTGTPVVPAG